MMEHPKGYVKYGFDTVVKFGGSLLESRASLKSGIYAVEAAHRLGNRLLVIPGGGPTDNTIEMLDEEYSFCPRTHHLACAKAQDQTGLMISDPGFDTLLTSCSNLLEARNIAEEGRIPVLLPSEVIFVVDPFEMTWDITSDGMAVWFAWLVGANLTAILTDVDGVFPVSSKDFSGEPLPTVLASELRTWGKTSVDTCVPEFALHRGIKVWVGNGRKPNCLSQHLVEEGSVGTLIVPK